MVPLFFGCFVTLLVGLLFWHKQKLLVVSAGFAVMCGLFLIDHGFDGFLHHMSEKERSHLLINLAGLLPGFAVLAYFAEHGGGTNFIARLLRSPALILVAVCVLSAGLDNIAAAMIGGTVLIALYGGPDKVPFKLIVGCIAAANLGGAPSFIGDTTTVMLYLSGVGPLELSKGIVAVIPAMTIITIWATWGIEQPPVRSADDAEGHKLRLGYLWPLLAIPGLVIGNVVADQPALGLWMGLGIGMLLARSLPDKKTVVEAIPNTLFLVLLVAAAELLPIKSMEPVLEGMSRDVVAVLLGHLSAFFDNIPLTACAIRLGGFDNALLAYCVGYGGSAMWFGSSAGVAMGLSFHEAHNTRKWIQPFFVVTLSYLAGVAVYKLVFGLIS